MFIGAMPLVLRDVKRTRSRVFKSGWVVNTDGVSWYMFVDRDRNLVSKTDRGRSGKVMRRQQIDWSCVTEVVVPEELRMHHYTTIVYNIRTLLSENTQSTNTKPLT